MESQFLLRRLDECRAALAEVTAERDKALADLAACEAAGVEVLRQRAAAMRVVEAARQCFPDDHPWKGYKPYSELHEALAAYDASQEQT